MTIIYDFAVSDINGKTVQMSEFKDKVLLIVNTASQCGFTPHYEFLQKLYSTYKADGLVVIGFPCNQFGSQEPGSEAEIMQFCETKYHVDFPMMQKIAVNGANAAPIYKYLKQQQPGILGSKAIKWNFTKFLVNRQGEVVARFAPIDSLASIKKAVQDLLV